MGAGFPDCQSCGMPLRRDERGGGTNADGTRSRRFCSHCFVDGRFTLPELTVEEMQARVRARMSELGVPGVLVSLFARKIPRLERWAGRRDD